MIGGHAPELRYEWNAAKAVGNFEKHGVPFEAIYRFDWEGAIEAEDTRHDYGEPRIQALGKIDDRYHVLAYTVRNDAIRVI